MIIINNKIKYKKLINIGGNVIFFVSNLLMKNSNDTLVILIWMDRHGHWHYDFVGAVDGAFCYKPASAIHARNVLNVDACGWT